MSVYHYVANKDEIVDAIVDLVYSEIELPIPGGDWQADGAASYVFGFALSENALPIHGPDSVADTAASMMERFFDAEAHPALFEFTTEHVMRPDYDFGREFEYGLTVILPALARALADDGGASGG